MTKGASKVAVITITINYYDYDFNRFSCVRNQAVLDTVNIWMGIICSRYTGKTISVVGFITYRK